MIIIKPGELVLLTNSVLAKVTKADDKGFHFHCINGEWSGYFNELDQTVSVDGMSVFHDAHITSTAQPPADIRDDYNAAIPWMRERSL